MITIKRTTSKDQHFITLVKHLDADLLNADGKALQDYYAQFNKITNYKYVVIAYINTTPVGCGAIKPYNENTMEIKRMFVCKAQRGLGIASQLLNNLECWTKELGYNRCILETGTKQIEALQLYRHKGYLPIKNYGQYIGVENSLCFEKLIF